jgi:hypothetical protein
MRIGDSRDWSEASLRDSLQDGGVGAALYPIDTARGQSPEESQVLAYSGSGATKFLPELLIRQSW